MTPHRVSPGGSFRFDRVFRGVGRLNLASGVHTRRDFEKLDAFLTKLYERGRHDLLRDIREHRRTALELYAADVENRLHAVTADAVLDRPLLGPGGAFEAVLPRMGRTESSRRRYEVSFDELERVGVLGAGAPVRTLADVDWRAVRVTWPAGPADFNRMRAAVSRFLTLALGDKYHPFRRRVVNAETFPRATEPSARVPDVTPELFWRIVAAAPEHVRASYVCLVATGMRVGEYLACRPEHLHPHTLSLSVPGTKTLASPAVLRIDERLWPWVKRAVPAPLTYKWLRKHWVEACEAVGVSDLRLHDLRHCTGQWLTDAGRPEASVQATLRHATAAMTRRYTMQRDRGQDAAMMATVLLGAPKKASRRRA